MCEIQSDFNIETILNLWKITERVLFTGSDSEKKEVTMFGYVTICEPELKVKDLKKYKAYYCGLCRTLKEEYGFMGQMTLTYDMTFAVILLSSLYESIAEVEMHRCKVHPVKKQPMLRNEITSYAAAMNVLLAYYHMEDDWQDDRKVTSLLTKNMIQGKAKKIIEQYPRQSRVIRESLQKLSACEKEESQDIDRAAGCFGELMAEMFVYKEDIWAKTLRKMGFYMGKFIYIMDAYEDLPEDIKKNRYNPLKTLAQRADYELQMQQILRMMIAESTARFEQLPCLVDVDILRNILYDGVWNHYNKIQMKKSEEQKS